jgi:hypothetical protein
VAVLRLALSSETLGGLNLGTDSPANIISIDSSA